MAIVITPEDVASRINGYHLSATSTPSIATVREVIAEDIAYVEMLVASKGVTIADGSAQETYLRGVVIRLVCAKIEQQRNRSTSAYSLDVEAKAMQEIEAFLGRAANLANADKGKTDKPQGGRGASACGCRPVSEVTLWRRGGKL